MSRLFFIYSPVKDWLINRIELSTPLTAWNRGMSQNKSSLGQFNVKIILRKCRISSKLTSRSQVARILLKIELACVIFLGATAG